MYGGAKPLKVLKTSDKILKSTQKDTGSQCSAAKTGVICSLYMLSHFIAFLWKDFF
uniref:Uncharacterized protein n=1 Tax=Anguilla anguilla TaxID=7936 RepID=A0A0E9Y0E4_ANGAN